ncbi:MAG: Crp/Fnr family transcriptional regulator [Elusimicrobiota bacterium]
MLSLDCNNCKFSSNCLYSKIKLEQVRQKWNKYKRTCSYRNGDIIYNEGDVPTAIYNVCKGRVKISRSSASGENIIIWIKNPGSMFGYYSLCRNELHKSSSKSMGDTIISTFPKDFFVDLLKSDFEFTLEIIKGFCSDILYLQTRLSNMAYKTAEEKIASVLINHISFSTKNTKTPYVYNLKRTEISEIAGLRIETVVRTLQKFEKRKIIKREQNSIKILSIDDLLKISNTNNN